MHYVDTLILPLLFSVFLVALGYLGWKDIKGERRRRADKTKVEPTETPAGRDQAGGKAKPS